MIFDIMLSGVSDGTVMHHTSVTMAKPIKPFNLKVPGTTLSDQMYQPCQLCILSFKYISYVYEDLSIIFKYL